MTIIEKIKQENNPKNTIIKYMKEYSKKPEEIVYYMHQNF